MSVSQYPKTKILLPIFTGVPILFFFTSTYVHVCLETITRLYSDHLRHMSSLTLRHATPSLYCACLLSHCVTPFLTHLHRHLPLTSTAAAKGSTRVVASASLLNVFSTTNLDARNQLRHLYTISLYPLIYQSPRQHTHTQLPYARTFHLMLRHRSHDFRAGHNTSNYTFSSSTSSDAQRPSDRAQHH